MALISAQALHLRPLSLPPPPSYLSVQSQFSPLAPIKTPAHPVFSIHGPKPACQISRQRGGVVPKATVSDYSSTIGDILGEVTIFTASGEPVKFEDLWDQNELPFPMDSLYADPDRKAYDVLSLYYGIGRTFFNPASAKVFSRLDALRNAVKNYTIEATPDDRSGVLQQGGMFVFKGKQLLFAWKDEGTGDHAPLSDIFDICCKVPVS